MTSSRVLPWILLACCTIACVSSHIPRSNSRSELEAYVRRAAQVVEQRGAESCGVLSQPAWMSGDYYIFVNEAENNTTVCHPLRPDFVGQNQDHLRDANGRDFPQEMQAVANAGGGWVEYVWPRPGQTTPEPKSTYVLAVTGPDGKRYVVGSGGYGMTP